MAQLKAQATKWQELWAGQQEKWDIFGLGLDLADVAAPGILTAKEIRDSAKSFKKRTTAVE